MRRITEVQARVRERLLDRNRQDDALFDIEIMPPKSLLIEVSAIYQVTYEAKVHEGRRQREAAPPGAAAAASGGGGGSGGGAAAAGAAEARGELAQGSDGLSFAWSICGDLLCMLKAMQLKQRRARGGGGAQPYLEALA